MTQEAMAGLLDIATKNLQRLESGTQNLTLETIERVARALDVPPESFFTIEPSGAMGEPTLRGQHADVAALEAIGYAARPATARGRRPKGAVPIVNLRAAAGLPARGARAADVTGWVSLDHGATTTEGRFVTRIEGDSMEPRIPSGAFVLFRPPAPGPLQGRVFLLEHPELVEGLSGPYIVKRVARVLDLEHGDKRITLRSDNRAYPDRVIVVRDEADLRIVAEMDRVLTAHAPTA